MNLNVCDDQQASDGMLSKQHTQNHRKIIGDILVALQKQEDIMKQLTEDLEFFRNKYKSSLNYDNGAGCYLADIGDKTIDLRSYDTDLGNGVIAAETAADFLGYRSAMNNFQMGFKKTKEEIEKIWEDVDLVRDVDNDKWVRKDSLKISSKWEADALEKGRKAAVQE
jgi:chaperonin cofactor prefoldin